MNLLEQLKKQTKVVADTSDFESMRKFKPVDATTNPSLIFIAAQDPKYAGIVNDTLENVRKEQLDRHTRLSLALDKFAVAFGLEILKIIPGRVSTEVDARLSFDTEGSIKKARELISLYEAAGIDRKRILIKLASTWEGIRAAKVLEKEDIRCNMTLLFSLTQAVAGAEAGVQLISPFVGRILDWHLKKLGVKSIPPTEDPGVRSVATIYQYFKKFGYKTEIMGASFRNMGEIVELAGCDLLTISPVFLNELEQTDGILERKLDPEKAKSSAIKKMELAENDFRWLMNEDAMASDKLAEGIRKFTEDLLKLEKFISERL
jgi:transaldolase